MFQRFRLRKKKGKESLVSEKSLKELLSKELSEYIKREDLQKYIEGIEKDKRKKELWDSLSARKKVKLLRYISGKEVKSGKTSS